MSKKILVVDDDFSQRDLYFELFRDSGFDVTAANDGQDAWEKIQKDQPDLVFTGILMPRMTGFELIEKLRNNHATQSLPVIIFSHLGRNEDRLRARTLSNVDFKIKGYDGPNSILKTVKNLLSTPSFAKPAVTASEDDRPGVPMI